MNMNNRRFWAVLVTMLVPAFVLFAIQYQYEDREAPIEEKIYNVATLEDEFADNKVVVVLNKEASMNFKTYTPEDFPEAFISRVDDSTRLTMELVRKQLEAAKTGDWGELKSHIENNMLVDIGNFRRILDLTLRYPGKENVLMTIEHLSNREDVLSVEPDYLMSIMGPPSPVPIYYHSDPSAKTPHVGQKTAFDQINLEDAWDIATGSASVMVGVMDTGIDASHPALSNRINTSLHRDFSNGIQSGLPNNNALVDTNAHGTIVAGIIGANGKHPTTGAPTGIIGVNQNVTLVSLKVMNGTNFWDAVRWAIDFATSNAIPILNFSGGGPQNINAVRTSIVNYPGLLVVPAGNTGVNIDNIQTYPASFKLNNIISVGGTKTGINLRAAATDWPGFSGSSFGLNTVSLFAPGTGLVSTYPTHLTSPSGTPGYWTNTYATSYSTPFVTGVAALIRSQSNRLDNNSIKKIIMNNVTNAPSLSSDCVSGGVVNAEAALNFTINSWIPCEWNCRQDCVQQCKDDCFESIVQDPTCLLNPGLCQIRYGECLAYCDSSYMMDLCVILPVFQHCRNGCS